MAPEKGREEMSQDVPSARTVVVRTAKSRRPSARGFEGFGKIEQLCKSIAVAALIAVIGIGCFSRFYAQRFGYLESSIAIEQAEIARHLRSGDGFTTSIGYLPGLDLKAGEGRWISTTYHPLYSMFLAGFFKVRGASDKGVALFNGLVHLVTGILVYLLALEVRGRRTAILAVILYYVSIEAIGTALSATGLTLTAFFLTLAIWAALRSRKAQTSEDADQAKKARLWAVLTGAGMGLAYLCGGLCVLLVIPMAMLAVADNAKRRETWALVCGAFILVLAPWVVRNLVVSGTLSPMLARYQLIAGTPSYPGSTVLQAFPGELPSNPSVWALTHPGDILKKLFVNSVSTYRQTPSFINLYLFPFVILFGLGFASNDGGKRLWGLLFLMLALQLITALLYNVTSELIELDMFLPVGLCLATAAISGVLVRHITKPVWQYAAALGMLVLVAFPYATSLIGGRTPGYAAWSIAPLSRYLTNDAVIATDTPLNVAWYSGRQAVLLPPKVEGMEKLAQHGADPDYVFLTNKAAQDSNNPWARVAFASRKKDEKAQKLIGKLIVFTTNLGDVPIYQRHAKTAEGVTVGPRKEKPGASKGAASKENASADKNASPPNDSNTGADAATGANAGE